MTKQQSLVVIIGCLIAVLMCIGVIVIVHQSAQALPSEHGASFDTAAASAQCVW